MKYLLLLMILLTNFSITAEPRVGAERLADYLPLLKNKRVAMMVNQSSLVGNKHLVDVLLKEGVTIQSILMVEHGFRGDLGAGEAVESGQDPVTGIPLISLYGKQKQLTAEQAADVDVLIYDLQDVGVRFYTYSRSLHFLLQSCQDFNKTLVVLDRPNPNGDYIAGPILEPDLTSGLSVDPLPLVHGLTMGELAQMILGEGWLAGAGSCELKVIPVSDYDHNQLYSLPVRPSPNLPNDLSIRLYPSLALFEGTSVSVGRGTDWPFQVLGYPDPRMGDFEFITRPISGSWKDLNHTGQKLFGERITSPEKFSLTTFLRWHQKFKFHGKQLISRPDFFDKLLGTRTVRKAIESGLSESEITAMWQAELRSFQQLRSKYLLYPDSDWIKKHYN
jgi:uncharacterized protein YbbC (DUF1343 family)